MKDDLDELLRLPALDLRVESETVLGDDGFVRIRRAKFRHARQGGERSPIYEYDAAERAAMDAVTLALTIGRGEETRVCLRSSVRPPLHFRRGYALPIAEPNAEAQLWELPAGLIEPEERGEAGIRECAARETLEEVGARLDPMAFEWLGPPTFPTPGVMAEKVYFLRARVDDVVLEAPTEDGSPLESGAFVKFVPLRALALALDEGRLLDATTEIGLRRLMRAEGVR